MPLYSYRCNVCRKRLDERRDVDDRNGKFIMHFKEADGQVVECKGMVSRVFTPAHNAPIPGQYNRLNRHWNESGTPIEREFSDLMVNQNG